MSPTQRERPENERYNEARALSALREPEAFAAARRLFADAAWRVRRAAWEALLEAPLDAPARNEFLLACLEAEDDAGMRGAALEAFIRLGGAAVDFLSRGIEARPPRTQRYILDVFVQLRLPACAPAARLLVGSTDDNVAFAAAEALGFSGDAADARFLFGLLGEGTPDRRFGLLNALVNIARRAPAGIDAAQVAPLLADPILRMPAAELLGLIGGADAARLLWEQIAPGKPLDTLVTSLAQALARGGGFDAGQVGDKLALVTERSRAPEAPLAVKRAAFEIAAELAPGYLAPLVPALAAADGQWLAERLTGFSQRQINEVLPALSVSEPGRGVAAKFYTLRPDLNAESALLALLNLPGAHRTEAVAALAAVGTPRVVPHLLAMLGDDDYELANRASETLLAMARRGVEGLVAGVVKAAAAAARPEVLARLLPTVGRLAGEPRVSELVCDAMGHADARVRRAAVEAAELLAHDGDAGRILISRLADEDEDVRTAAAVACGRARLAEAAGPLEILLDDPSPWVQAAALDALAAAGHAPSPGRLAALLQRGGVVGVGAAQLAQSAGEGAFASLAAALPALDDDTAAELLKVLAAFAGEVPRATVEAMLGRDGWSVRAAAAQYLAARRPAWGAEVGRQFLAREEDELVRMRLIELTGGDGDVRR